MNKLNSYNPSIKIALIFALVLLLLIPIQMIKSLINDRKSYQDEAIKSITEPLGGETEIQGLVIAVPYNIHNYSTETVETKYIVFAPVSYNVDFNVSSKELSRGIFKIPFFTGNAAINAKFDNFDYSYFNIKEEDILKKDAILILGFSGKKNFTSMPKFSINGKELSAAIIKDESISPFYRSLFYKLSDSDIDLSNALNLKGSIDFQGGENIKIRPIATDTRITMKSDWHSPSFSGGWLPKEREVSAKGFTALWDIAGLSTAYPKSWPSEKKFDFTSLEYVNASFIIPVNAYTKTERSVKYSILFLLIPFIALFVSEIFSKIRIHPIQYAMIGLADVIFYLLLLSISEHLSFDITYWICSISVCLSTLFYATAIFKKIKWGGMLSCVQFVSYFFLFGILQAEDYALLLGSIGLFTALLALMFITRKIDWYKLGTNSAEANAPVSNTQNENQDKPKNLPE